jgi:hypothetical protein
VTALKCNEPHCVCSGLEDAGDQEASLWLVTKDRHPSVRDAAQWFRFDHLPAGPLQEVSKAACQLAYTMIASLPDSPQLTIGLHELLAAKDAFVRAATLLDEPHGRD